MMPVSCNTVRCFAGPITKYTIRESIFGVSIWDKSIYVAILVLGSVFDTIWTWGHQSAAAVALFERWAPIATQCGQESVEGGDEAHGGEEEFRKGFQHFDEGKWHGEEVTQIMDTTEETYDW